MIQVMGLCFHPARHYSSTDITITHRYQDSAQHGVLGLTEYSTCQKLSNIDMCKILQKSWAVGP